MRGAYKYRLYPTRAQVTFLEGQLCEACHLYNAALEERRGAWKVCRKSLAPFARGENPRFTESFKYCLDLWDGSPSWHGDRNIEAKPPNYANVRLVISL